MLYNLSFKHKLPEDAIIINVTSRSNSSGKYLSPFFVGPVDLYDGYVSQNIENAYQFSKIYPLFVFEYKPTDTYFEWAKQGWENKTPIKYPFGVWNEALYHWWDGKKVSRQDAQNEIFIPLYSKAVVKTKEYQELKKLYHTTDKDIILLDFEGHDHRLLEMSLDDVYNNKDYAIGQGFTLLMLLEGYLKEDV